MPGMSKKEIRVATIVYEDGTTAIDARVWRKFEGKRDWMPGKGLRFDAADAAALIAGITREVKKGERAAKKLAA